MKMRYHYFLVAFLGLALLSCKKDNYDPPSSELQGNLVYQGVPLGFEADQVLYRIYQYGFGRVTPIESYFSQEGHYAELLFDGEYKFIIPNGQGPFLWNKLPSGDPDTLTIDLSGSKQMDIEVTPYYMIRNPQLSASGGKVNATFSVEKIVTGADAKDIERVSLYINKTQFVSARGDHRIANADMGGAAITDPNNISLSVDIPSITPTQNYVYARVGVKIAGVEDMLYSPVQKLDF